MTCKHLVFCFIILPLGIIAQESKIDSLLLELDDREVFDQQYVDLVNDLSFEYLKSDPIKVPYYTNLAISVSKEIDYTAGLIRATTNKGSSYWVNGLQDEALSYYLLSLSYSAHEYPLEYARLNNNIGEVFKKKLLFDSSLKYYRNALEMVKNQLPNRNPAILYSNVGEVYLMKNKLDSAEYYYRQCLDSALKNNEQRALAYSYYGLGEIAFFQFDILKAEDFQKKSLEIRRKINDTRGLIQSYIKLGTYEVHKSNPIKAFEYWNEAEKLAISFRAIDLLNDIYISKSDYYYQTQQYKEAAEYISAYTTLNDSLKSLEFTSSLNRTKTALLTEIRDAENKLLIQQQAQANEETRLRFLLLGGIATILISIVVITRFYRRRRKDKQEIERETVVNDSLLKLSKEVNAKQSEYDHFITELLVHTRNVLMTDRASYWYLDNQEKNLVCYRLIDSGELKETVGSIPKTSSIFFKELITNRTFAVSDVLNDPRCADISFKELVGDSITSFLAAPMYLNDKFIGVIGYSMVNSRRVWSFSDQRYVASLADILVSALANDEKIKLEREKELLITKLLKKNKSLKEFNSVISHNMREPLAQVIGFSNLLSENNDLTEEEWKEVILRLNQSSEKIDSVIKDLSTLLNEKDIKQKDFKKTSLSKVLEEVIESLSGEISKVNPLINSDFESPSIVTYEPFIFDIIYHQLSNAIKFRNPNKQLEIKVSSSEDDNFYFLQFSDNGRGMDLKSFKDRIFKMYMRHHHDVEGRGVGLYIMKNRVESLNGEIKVDSKVMKGTTFKITLPKKR